MSRAAKVKTAARVVLLVVCSLSHAGLSADTDALTFFGWSDQHVKTDGDGKHLIPAIDAMNALAGRAYPASIGGKVDEPDFVTGLGDITEWPTHAAKDTYEKFITELLRFPSYDVAGNHDSGGLAPSPTIHDWLKRRHGSLSYTFDSKGVHFVALYSKYDESLNSPAQPLSQQALQYLRADLSKVPEGTPVVVATHLCFEAITNKDEFVDAFGDSNVILVLGGHYHKAAVDKYRGINFVQLPSPAPGSPSEITVIRIEAERLLAVPFDYEKKQWSTDPKKLLDTAIKGPGGMSVSRQSATRKDDAGNCRPLFVDTHFRQGFRLSYPDSGRGAAAEAVLDLGDPNNKPVWRLCQWATKHSLATAPCTHHPNGNVSYGNQAKMVLVGAAGSANRDLILEIKAGAEYGDRPRQRGESWPHLLVEQRASEVHTLDRLAGLALALKVKLLYSRSHMSGETYDPSLHAAQFQMFLVVKNVDKQSNDYRGYYWFGVPFYDSRHDIPPSYKARDGGKDDATGKFIYTIAGEQVNTKPLKDNEWVQIDADILAHIKAGLQEAAKRGYFKDADVMHWAVTGMNMGWELPGTFDASMQVRDLSVMAVLQ